MGGIILKLLLDVICYLLTADETFGIAQMYLRELWSASGSWEGRLCACVCRYKHMKKQKILKKAKGTTYLYTVYFCMEVVEE